MRLVRGETVFLDGDEKPLGKVGDHGPHFFTLVMPGLGEFLISRDQIKALEEGRVTLNRASATDRLLLAAALRGRSQSPKNGLLF
jgi:hypothetical protein